MKAPPRRPATIDASSLSRRALLKMAGFGAAAAAFGACTNEDGTPAAPGERPLDGSVPGWDELRRKMRGTLILPGDPRYDGARRGYNSLFDGQRPAAVAECESPSDVQACIEAARRNSVPVAARSGGHSYGGYSTASNSLVVDVKRLSKVVPDSDNVIVGAGAQLIDVYAALAAVGRCLPSGSCPNVGISGITLGGGLGVLTRMYGLTCDALLSADIVLADGTRRTVSRQADERLFWALRGGGGGNFGVVTSFTFRTQPAPEVLTVFGLPFPAGSAVDVFGAWQFWQEARPNELWSNCVVSGGGGKPPGIYIGGCFVGTSAALGPHLDELVQQAGVQPTSRSAIEKNYMDAMMYFAGCPTIGVEQCHVREEGDAGTGQLDRASFVGSSRILSSATDPQSIADLMRDQVSLNLLIDSLGGAVRNVGGDDSAFPHRRALATIQIYRAATVENREESEQAVAHVQSRLAQFVGHDAYVNYIDPRMPDWGAAYYGTNLVRLHQAAKKYDPDKFFDFPQSIHRT